MITYFYTLSSTRDLNDIRYVGKTIKPLQYRLKQHLLKARKALESNYTHNHEYNWINKELKEGFEIKIEYLDECSDDVSWQIIETYWISQFKIWGFKLTNISEGGEGLPGIKQDKNWVEKRISKQVGVPRSEICKKHISESLIGKKHTEEHNLNVKNSIIKLQGRAINQYDLEGNFIKTWEYIKQASQALKIDESNIGACCKHKPNHSTAGGFIWRYIEDDSPIKIDKSKYIVQLNFDGSLVNIWKNANLAAKEFNLKGNSILKNCRKEFKQCGGYVFMFYEDFLQYSKDELIEFCNSSKKGSRLQIGQYDKNGKLIQIFKNCTEAGKILNIDRKKIGKCCKGEIDSLNEFIFKYI